MEEKQKQFMLNSRETPARDEDVYTWSTIRVAEGIAINLGSAILIAILTAIVAFLPSTLLLLIQYLFHFLVIPTNWLAIMAFFGGAVLFVLLIGVGLLNLFVRKHPTIVGMMLLGAAVGFAVESKFSIIDLFKTASHEQNNPPNEQSK